jgi:small neutral amino acid transporter SnatA (MarC family)
MAGLGAVAAAGLALGIVAPPEHCPPVSASELRAAAGETVDWFVRNQRADGTWLYLYDADTDTAPREYNAVRHAGVAMGLYQAASAGLPGALDAADRGVVWAEDRLIEHDGWAALRYQGQTSAGAAALLVAGLAERRTLTGDGRYDELLARLGRFLVAQTEPSGAVLATYDVRSGAPVAGAYSAYYTGETYWALARLHRLFPGGGWGEVADRIGAYLATRRDDAEEHWPAIPDHWAAYGLAETVAFAERADGAPLDEDELWYARRQAGLWGSQVRWVSQRFGPWGALVRSPHVPRGGGYGVVGEGLTGLWRVAVDEPRLADLRAPLAERAACIAGLAVARQVDASDAGDYPAPQRARGAWFRDGETRMDDQQHALAALLRTMAIVDQSSAGPSAGSSDPDGQSSAGPGPRRPAPPVWLWVAALLAALNPFRAVLGVPRGERDRREVARVAALGATAGALVVVAAALAVGAVLDAAEVSSPALRIAAGAVAAIVGGADLVRRPPPAEPALPGWRAALVPIAVPLTARPALVLLAMGARADRGWAVVAATLAVGVALLAALAAYAPVDGPGGRAGRWAGRVTAAALVATSILLVVDGIYDV